MSEYLQQAEDVIRRVAGAHSGGLGSGSADISWRECAAVRDELDTLRRQLTQVKAEKDKLECGLQTDLLDMKVERDAETRRADEAELAVENARQAHRTAIQA